MNDFFNINDTEPGDEYITIHGSIIPSKGDVPFTTGTARLHGPNGYQSYDVARFTIKTIDQNRVSVTVPCFLLPNSNLRWAERSIFVGGAATCEGKASRAKSKNTGKEHINFLCSVTPWVGIPIGQDPRDAAIIALNKRIGELEALVCKGADAGAPQQSQTTQRLIVPTVEEHPKEGVYVQGRRL